MSLSLQSNRDNQLYDQQLFNSMTSPMRRPLYLPGPMAKGNMFEGLQMFGDAFTDLKNTFSNRKLKKELYKQSLPEYYRYTVEKDPNDPNEYVLDNRDLYDAMMGEGTLRTPDVYQSDLQKYSMVNFDPESGMYNTMYSSRPVDEDVFGEGSKSLGQFLEDMQGNPELANLIMQAEEAPEGFFPYMEPDGRMGVTEDPNYLQYYYNTMMGNYEMGGSLPEAQVGMSLFDPNAIDAGIGGAGGGAGLRSNPNVSTESLSQLSANLRDFFNRLRGLKLFANEYGGSLPEAQVMGEFGEMYLDPNKPISQQSNTPTKEEIERANIATAGAIQYGIENPRAKSNPQYKDVRSVLEASLPSSYFDEPLFNKLLNVDLDTAEDIADVYGSFTNKDFDISDISSLDFGKSDIQNIMQQTGITKDDIRDFIYDQDFYKDADKLERFGIRSGLSMYGLNYGGSLPKAQFNVNSESEEILIDSLPSSIMDSVIGQGLINVDVNTANRIADVYDQAKDITNLSEGLSFFKGVSKKEIQDVMQQSGLTKEDIRNYVYDQPFYEDANRMTQLGIRSAMKLKGLKTGGDLAKAQFRTALEKSFADNPPEKIVSTLEKSKRIGDEDYQISMNSYLPEIVIEAERGEQDKGPTLGEMLRFDELLNQPESNEFRINPEYDPNTAIIDNTGVVVPKFDMEGNYMGEGPMYSNVSEYLGDSGGDKRSDLEKMEPLLKVLDYAALVGAFTPAYPLAYTYSMARALQKTDPYAGGADAVALVAKRHPAVQAGLKVFGKLGPKIPSLINKFITKTPARDPIEGVVYDIVDELKKIPEYSSMGVEYLTEEAQKIAKGLYDSYQNTIEDYPIEGQPQFYPQQKYGGLIKAQAGLSFEEWFIQNQVRASGMTEAEMKRAYDQDTMDPQEFGEKYMDIDFTVDEVPMPRLEDDPETMPFDVALGDIEIDEVPMPRLEDDFVIASPTVTGKKDNLSRALDSPFAQGFGAIGRSAVGVAQGLDQIVGLNRVARQAEEDLMRTTAADNAFMVTNPLMPQGTVDVNTGLRMTSGGFGLAKFGTETEMEVEADPETIKALMDAGVNVNYI